MAEGGKMFAGAKTLGKRVPKWAWYVSGGVAVAGGIYYFRSRQVVTEPGGDLAADEGAVGYTDPSQGYAPGLIVAGQEPGEAVSAELNTDIPSETIGIFGGVITDLVGLVESGRQDQSEILGLLANGGAAGQQGANAGGVVTANPVSSPTKTKPKPNPVAKLPGGFRAGATVDMGPHARKTFKGAIGWQRIADGGKGAAHWIDIHVRYCNKLERWRVRPNAKGSPWNKTWQGSRPEICK